MNQEELDKLYNALFKAYLPPVTEIKPSEIEKLEEVERHNYKDQFHKSLEVYVKPLEKLVKKLLDSVNKEKYTYNVDNLSILERVSLYRNVLTQSGFTKEQLTSLVPKTEDEFDLLAKALANGFDDKNILDNETRVREAKEFLQSLGENVSSGRKVA